MANILGIGTRWLKKHNVSLCSLIISMFFLPLDLRLNNIFLVIFFILFVLEGNFQEKTISLSSNFARTIPVILLFFLSSIGYLYSFYVDSAADHILKIAPIILIPIIFVSDPQTFSENRNKLFYSLTGGCLVAVFISWGWLFQELWASGDFSKIITWQYNRGNLISNIDQHATYLSMFLFTSIGFVISRIEEIENTKIKRFLFIVTIIQTLFLIQLLSRIAILYFLAAAIAFLLIKRRIFLLVMLMLMSFSFFTVLVLGPDDKYGYFEKILYREIGLRGANSLDPRIERWHYSWDLFKKSPIIGVGTGDADIMRVIAYKEGGDLAAYKLKYNAHNQFFEYLSANGIVGGILFLFCFGYLIIMALKTKEYLLCYVVVGIFVCCATESILRRSWGVVFFSIMAALVLVSCIINQRNILTQQSK